MLVSPVLSIDEVVRLFGGRLSRSTVYRAARDGRIPSLRVGRRLFVLRVWVDRLLDGGATGEVAA